MNTVEGALVLTAITAVCGLGAAGFVTLGIAGATDAIARDAARAAALGLDPASIVAARSPGATVQVSSAAIGTSGGGANGAEPVRAVTVSVTRDAPLLDITRTATVVAEP